MHDGDLDEVCALWRLGDIASVAPCENGTMNDTYVVAAGDRRVVLKRHQLFPDRPRVDAELALRAAARAGGVPVPAATPLPDGALVAERRGATYSLSEYAEGSQVARIRLTAEHAMAMGQALAHLHRAICGAPPVSTRSASTGYDVATTYAHVQKLIIRIEHDGQRRLADRWALERLRSRLDWIDRHEAEPPDVPDLPVQTLHGDYQQANVFFDGARVSAVIDWDTAFVGSVGDEAVRAMALSFSFDPALSQAFITGYRAKAPLDLTDLDMAAEVYGWRQLHSTWLYDAVYLYGDDRPLRFLTPGPYVPVIDRWRDVRPRLR